MALLRSRLASVSSAGEVPRPFAEYLRQLVVESGGVGCDETRVTLLPPATIPAIDPNDPRSRRIHEVISQAHKEGRKSIMARMWAYRSFVLPINVFDFTVSRHRDGPDEVLKSFTGKLMADCWSSLLGSLLVTSIQLAAMGRAELPESKRTDHYM